MTAGERWPLAPGKAPADVEARFAAEAARWPEPSTDLRDRVRGILSRPDRKKTAS